MILIGLNILLLLICITFKLGVIDQLQGTLLIIAGLLAAAADFMMKNSRDNGNRIDIDEILHRFGELNQRLEGIRRKITELEDLIMEG